MNKFFIKIAGILNSWMRRDIKSASVINPWAGLSSYEDPIKTDNPRKFCGREEDSLEVFKLIDDNIVVTLYGKSGIGKTSLLNAGVFPILRRNSYVPLYMRFGTADKGGTTLAAQLTNTLTDQLEETYGYDSIEIIDVVPENKNTESEEYLWSYFARRRFKDKDGNIIFPVIVLDQFEENIRINRHQTSLLLKQIAYLSNRQNMIKDTIVNDSYYFYDYNFRFVISIREDDLYRLEDIININYLSDLRNGRYRLQNLSEENAGLIIKKVGDGFINEADTDSVSRKIIEISKSREDGLIQTNVVSLICSRLFNIIAQKGQSKITLQDVESYLSTDPFEEYYNTAVKKLSEGEKRFIETRLVTADGRRNMLPENVVKESISSYNNLIDNETSIFHRIKFPDGENLIELIHDGVCPTVLKNRTIRLEKKNKTIMSLCLLIFGLIGLWMLNTSVINNLVDFFFKLGNSKVDSGLGYISILSLIEVIFVFLCPIAIGSVIYDYRKKKSVSILTSFLYFLPFFLFPKSCLNLIKENLSLIVDNYEQCGISDALNNVSDNFSVFIIFTIAILVLFLLNSFGKPGIQRKEKFFKLLWNSLSVRIYFIVIAGFLFYKSIFNAQFTINSYDSSWGLIVIPLMALSVFGVNIANKKNKIAINIYVILLVFLTVCSFCQFYLPVILQISFFAIAFLLLIIAYYKNDFFTASLKSLANIAILAIVVLLQNGYNPLTFKSPKIAEVYPWKIVVSEDNNKYGIYDAVYGDTLLIPEFNKDTTRLLTFYRILSKNSYTDSINDTSKIIISKSFPLKLTEIGTGEWKLSLLYSPKFERVISRLAHSETKDSTMLADKDGAKLFKKIRNDITKFCISGNNSILLSDVLHIDSYENILRYNLDNSLSNLYSKDSLMTEEDIIPFLKAISRSLYMNMLKESILRDHYNDFISWYSSYYIPTILANASSENGMGWTISDQTKSFIITIDGLNDNRVYAWNNLFSSLFYLESAAYGPQYLSNISNKVQKDNMIADSMLIYLKKTKNNLDNYKRELLKQNNELDNILNNLNDINSRDEKMKRDDIAKIITTVIDVQNISKKVERGISSEMNQFGTNMTALSDSLKSIALQQTDRQFEVFVTNTFSSLTKIIDENPDNAYNGLFISICRQLYVIGILRGYDMEKFAKQLDKIENDTTLPLYNVIKEAEIALKNNAQKQNAIRNLIKSIEIQTNRCYLLNNKRANEINSDSFKR